ncbi:MAG: glycoside hydrolase family 3 C-terminal domain-containing protein [Opitutales bacterium]
MSRLPHLLFLASFLPPLALSAQDGPEDALPPEVRANFAREIVLAEDDVRFFAEPPAGYRELPESGLRGTVEEFTYSSGVTGTERRAKVYLPPGYSPEERYPVAYLLHGIGGDEHEWIGYVKADAILDNLIAAGEAVPMIAVFPNGRAMADDGIPENPFNPTAQEAFAAFEEDLLEHLIPAIEARYATISGAEHRALAGLSMGGGQTLNFGLGHLDTFTWIGAFSPAPNTQPPEALVPDPEAAREQLNLLYLSCGNRDGLINVSQRTQRHLAAHEVPHIWHVDDHGHDGETWGSNLYHFAQRLFRDGTEEATPVFRDPDRPRDVRLADLIARLTLEEKTGLMSNSTPGIPRLGIPPYDWWNEALHGVANADIATVFPQAIGLASMWNEELHGEMAGIIGIEGRAKFNGYKGTELEGRIFRGLTFWSPNINIFRDPRWGRGQETYGEDPWLTARLGSAFVRGLQGDHPDYLLAAACAKHYAVHSGPEPLRHDFDATPPEADVFDTYLPAFEALVTEADVEIVMMAYNALDGIPASVHPLLYALLDEWGFDGHVTSDCESVDDLHETYGTAANDIEANALVLEAGMDLRCGDESAALLEAVQTGLVSEEALDASLAELLSTLFRLGFFDPAERVPFNAIPPERNDAPAHGELALEVTRQSMVLLKNEGVLPLDPAKLDRIAVIGPNATSVPVLLGNYNGIPSAPVTILEGLKTALETAGVTIDYAHGVDYAERPTTLRQHFGGWFHGEYFDNDAFTGEPLTRITTRPLRFGYDRPEGWPEDAVAVRWNGHLETTLGGEHELLLRGEGRFRLYLEDELVLDAWTPAENSGEEREVRVTRELADNSALPLRLEYAREDGPVKVAFEWRTPAVDSQLEEAVAVAEQADLILYVGGISAQLEGEAMPVDYVGFEGGDRVSIELPALQQRLLDRLHATGKPLVMVNLSGSAIAFGRAAEQADAILQAWYPGQAGGTAVAEVLLGETNPAGRLPVTFYRSTEDLPPFEDYAMAGRTYRYFEGEPLFAFGHGLSYTEFGYGPLAVEPDGAGGFIATVEVTNRGERAGDEVVQLYATPPEGAGRDERLALGAFDRVHLAPGETATVHLAVPAKTLRRWHAESQSYTVPFGEWTFAVGAASDDLRARATVTLR